MKIITDENGVGVASWGQPVGVACKCGHRGLVPLEGLKINGSMERFRNRKFKCSHCGGADVELVLFSTGAQADAFWEGQTYADVWDLRLYGCNLSEYPWKMYVGRPNPFRSLDHETSDE